MPELPEVETVCRGLSKTIINQKITHAENMRPNLRIAFPDNFSSHLMDKTVIDVKRRAKYILLTLSDETIIIIHLGMSGKIVVNKDLEQELKKHDHAIIGFDNFELRYNDPRRFGLITFSDTANINNHKLIKHLGIEPLEEEFDGKKLYELLKNKKIPVKNAIMDANLVVGVGNIYASEALFRSGIMPTRTSNKVTKKECEILANKIKDVLNDAIDSGGSTLRDYVRSSGEAGYFQHKFNVYGKDGSACIICNNEIKKIKQSGRSTYYCDVCQK